MQTRRDLLKFAAMLSGSAGLSGFVPESIQRAYAIPAEPGSTYLDAEHIVILMQENRSFDHAFGSLRGVRGFNDPRALRLANGNSVFVQTDKAGNSYTPWRLDILDTRITWMGSLPHSRHSQVDAWNDGHHDGWIDAKRSGEKEYQRLPLTMGYYTREDLPFYYALADAFTICDQNYCSVMTSTSPNRSYFWTGTIRDEQRADSRVHIRNEEIDDGGMTWKTFPERLQEAGISWKSYQNELSRSGLEGDEDAWLSNFGDNVLECFAAYNVEAYPGFVAACRRSLAELSDKAVKIESEISAANDGNGSTLSKKLDEIKNQMEALRASIVKGGEARYSQLSDKEKALHHAAFVTNASDPHCHELESLSFEFEGQIRSTKVPKGDVLYQFRKDVKDGKLPTVSWLTASERFSDHPSSPWYGAWYLSEVIDILTSNPEVWKKTIFILTYDENDGYFDHAPSFVAADPKRPETGDASPGIDTVLEYTYKEDELRMGVAERDARSGPIGMGFRVPMIVASPWSRGGWVNSQLFDHTSTLRFLESFIAEKYGKAVREENISQWRRAIAGDLSSVFRPQNAQEPELDYLNRDKFVVSIEKARYRQLPVGYKKLTPAEIHEVNRSPRDSKWMPRQEKGVRPACGLPYELYADGNVSADRQQFEVRLRAGNLVHGARSSGAPFNVYLRNLKGQPAHGLRAATFAVEAGREISLQYPLTMFADSRYVLDVHGPNGFFRSFSGAPGGQAANVHMAFERVATKWSGNALVRVENSSGSPITIEITDGAYSAAGVTLALGPGQEQSVVLPLEQSRGWYDFTVKASGSHAFAHFAGRVENGMPGASDPQMGGA